MIWSLLTEHITSNFCKTVFHKFYLVNSRILCFKKLWIEWWNDWYELPLTLSWRRPLSYRNQSINLESKSIDWFLYKWDSVMKEVQKKDRQEQINYFLDKVQHFRGLNEFKQLLNFYSPWNHQKTANDNLKMKHSLKNITCTFPVRLLASTYYPRQIIGTQLSAGERNAMWQEMPETYSRPYQTPTTEIALCKKTPPS